mmetsp:Transcript_22533/g.53289  ORF Transcript_22533/g.53289 Transcript_22533/m.53289 type:complete len:273 (-) Transcript_22533:657-1475(-)
MIVLGTKLKVTHDNGDLGTGHEENDEDQEEEAEEVVELVEPDGAENEEELHEHGAERENTAHKDGQDRVHIPGLRRDLAGYLVGADGVLNGLLLEAKVGTQKHQRDADSEPHEQQRHQRAKWHRAGRALAPNGEVEDEEDEEDGAGEHERREERHALPCRAPQHFVNARTKVTTEDSHEHEEKQGGGHQRTAVGRGQESEQSEGHHDEAHEQHLDTRADKHGEERGVARGTEDVAVDELPARLLLRILVHVRLFVAAKVVLERTDHDHGDQT